MKRGLLGLIVVILLSPTAVLGQSRDFSDTVDFTPGSDLMIRTDKGSLKLTSWDQNRVEIIARIEAPRDVDRDYAEEAVQDIFMQLWRQAGRYDPSRRGRDPRRRHRSGAARRSAR